MLFLKKHNKKGLKKTQTNYAKSNAPAEPIKDPVKPKVVNPRWLTQGD